MSLLCEMTLNSVKLGMLKLTSGTIEEIGEGLKSNLRLIDWLVLINQGKVVDFRINENGDMCFYDRVCVPDELELKKSILK